MHCWGRGRGWPSWRQNAEDGDDTGQIPSREEPFFLGPVLGTVPVPEGEGEGCGLPVSLGTLIPRYRALLSSAVTCQQVAQATDNLETLGP